MSNIDKLKPGKYAILFRNNWDGEGDTYEAFATLDADGIWRNEDGDELLEYQGDEVLRAWPLDDGSNVLALLDELETKEEERANWFQMAQKLGEDLDAAEKRIAELEARAISIPEVRITVAESKRKNLTWRELGAYNEGADVSKEAILAVIRDAGIGVKGE